MPQVLSSLLLLVMNTGENPASQALSSSVLTRSSIGAIAPSSISVKRSADSMTASSGGWPALNAVSDLLIVSE